MSQLALRGELVAIRACGIAAARGLAPILVVAADGAHAPTRPKAGRKTKRGPGRWREVKGFRLYLVGDDERIVQLASWHQIQEAEHFDRLEASAERLYMDVGFSRETLRSAIEQTHRVPWTVLDAAAGGGFQAPGWAAASSARLTTRRSLSPCMATRSC